MSFWGTGWRSDMSAVSHQASKNVHTWEGLVAMLGLQCISFPEWYFKPKRIFFQPREQAETHGNVLPKMHQTKADADLLIIQTAVASAETLVVGNSTDRVCQSCQNVNFRVFFKPKEEKHVQSCVWKPLLTTFSSFVLCGVVMPPRLSGLGKN